MKKFVTIFFVMLGLCASLCAEPKSSIYLSASVKAGAGNEDGADNSHDGLAIWIGYVDPTGLEAVTPSLGTKYTDGELTDLPTDNSANPITVELYGSGEESFDIFVAAQTNNITKTETTVSFSLKDDRGWQHTTDTSQEDIQISFELTGEKNEEDKLYCIASDNTLTITAEESTKTETPIYIGKASAVWEKSTDYQAGTWKANIIVTISPASA